jgi:hypothetical protein
MKRSLLAVTVALAAVALSQAVPAPVAASKGLIADGRPPDLLLMYTGDVIGYVDPCG